MISCIGGVWQIGSDIWRFSFIEKWQQVKGKKKDHYPPLHLSLLMSFPACLHLVCCSLCCLHVAHCTVYLVTNNLTRARTHTVFTRLADGIIWPGTVIGQHPVDMESCGGRQRAIQRRAVVCMDDDSGGIFEEFSSELELSEVTTCCIKDSVWMNPDWIFFTTMTSCCWKLTGWMLIR